MGDSLHLCKARPSTGTTKKTLHGTDLRCTDSGKASCLIPMPAAGRGAPRLWLTCAPNVVQLIIVATLQQSVSHSLSLIAFLLHYFVTPRVPYGDARRLQITVTRPPQSPIGLRQQIFHVTSLEVLFLHCPSFHDSLPPGASAVLVVPPFGLLRLCHRRHVTLPSFSGVSGPAFLAVGLFSSLACLCACSKVWSRQVIALVEMQDENACSIFPFGAFFLCPHHPSDAARVCQQDLVLRACGGRGVPSEAATSLSCCAVFFGDCPHRARFWSLLLPRSCLHRRRAAFFLLLCLQRFCSQ